jgi:glycosyltransferase involved in cell wall biosynthesis
VSRLFVFTETYARGGGNRYMIDLVNALAPAFGETVLATNPGGLFVEDTAHLDADPRVCTVDVVTRGKLARKLGGRARAPRRLLLAALTVLEPVFLLLNVVRFLRVLRETAPRYVLSCNGGYPAAEASLALVLAARLARLPVVLSIVSMPTRRRWYAWLYEWTLDHLVWRSAEAIIVNAQMIATALVALRGAGKARLLVVHNGLEDRPALERADQGERIVLGCVARLDRMKGVFVLLEAFASLTARYPKLHLVFAGRGDSDAQMHAETATLGLQSRVEFLGHFSGDIAALLSEFDIFVFPSLWEGFPYSIVEAMRSGMPIVATDVGGIMEAIDSGREGLLVSPGSAAELAAAIEKLLAEPQLRRQFGLAARQRFQRELSLDQMHRRVRDLLSQSVARAVV